jgi:hypothetical protein
MNVLRFIRLLRATLVMAVFVLAAYIVGGQVIWTEISREAACRAEWGKGWESEYEKQFGSLTDARVKIALCALALFATFCLLMKLARELRPG